MLTSALEDRFRSALGPQAHAERTSSIRFAVDLARLVIRALPEDLDEDAIRTIAEAIRARTDLSEGETATLMELALAPENRNEVTPDEVRAFGARFGAAAENALIADLQSETSLEGFAERYGPEEALLLLDGLFAVCASDGEIDYQEIDRLQRAAERLRVDPRLVGLLLRKHDVRHAQGDVVFLLTDREEVIIGRGRSAELQLPDPQVADRHAALRRTPEGWVLEDLGSGRPTLVGGVPVERVDLTPGDEIRIGPWRVVLHRSGEALTAFGRMAVSSLSCRGVRRALPDTQGTVPLLDDISLTVFTGEVIALVGPSGSGKTTLLHAIAGIAPPDQGEIRFERADFHAMLEADRSLVGIVPQDDIVHGSLTVEEALQYAARLRLPPDASTQDVQEAVHRVLDEVDLTHVRDRRIGDSVQRGVSGGQRKRVNLGQELLTRTTRVLFLDEPTSGLDPQTAQEIVGRVRQLADDGRTVFLVTHDVTPAILTLVDHLCVLAPGGRLAWFGPPAEAVSWFGVDSVDEIFARLPDKSPEAWRDAFRQSQAWRTYIRTREHLLGLDATHAPELRPRRQRGQFLRHWRSLVHRDMVVRLRDRVGTAVLLGQAPLLALAFSLVFPKVDGGTLFVTMLSSLWFGASASVRELIADRPIRQREARVGVGLAPYLLSKLSMLSVLVASQCLLLITTLTVLLRHPMEGGSVSGLVDYGFALPQLVGISVLVGWVGMCLGLMLSSLFQSSEAAVGSLPLVLIPQIAFGGLLVKVKDMDALSWGLSHLTITRYGFEAALKTGEQVSVPGLKGLGDSTRKVSAYLWELGFRRSTSIEDGGLSLIALTGILLAFAFTFLLVTAMVEHRRTAQG